MTASTGAIDIVIVNYNTRALTMACLASIARHPPAAPGTVFVVDNASSDGSIEAIGAAFPSVVLISLDRNAGFGAANNIALRRATAPLVLLLNSDTVVHARSIDRLRERLEATGAAAAGPRLVDDTGRPEVSFGSMLSPATELVQAIRVRLSRKAGGSRYIGRLTSRERFTDWVSGACLLVRREAALAAGLFDDRYFLYEEDVDFCAALRLRGGRILFSPAAEVTHVGGASGRGSVSEPGAPGRDSRAHYDRSHLAFYQKHRPGWVPLLRLWQRWK